MAIEGENKKFNKNNTRKSLHTGHRKRVIKKYMEHGLDSFAEHEVLEIMLFFSVPRIDTNPLAHRLINEFGSLQNVLSATAEDLKRVEGVGDNTATLISLFRAIREYQNTHLFQKSVKFNETAEFGMFCVEYFSAHIEESAIMLALDPRSRLKKVSVISKGTINETYFNVSKIVKDALNLRATGIIIAHNHPDGSLQPSSSDVILTKDLRELLANVHIDLVDHIICNDKYFTSFRERGLFDRL